MNTAFLKVYFLFCVFSFSSCLRRGEQVEGNFPLELRLTNRLIEPLDSSYDDIYYIYKLNGWLKNNTPDTVWTVTGIKSNSLICKIHYYIVKSKTVYKGVHIPHSPWSELNMICPADTINFSTLFVLKKEYTEMEDLYIGITPSFSLDLTPFDTIVTQLPKRHLNNVAYQPIYKFHINSKNNEIKQINFDIDSMMAIKKFEIVPVNFW